VHTQTCSARRAPECSACPLTEHCVYYQSGASTAVTSTTTATSVSADDDSVTSSPKGKGKARSTKRPKKAVVKSEQDASDADAGVSSVDGTVGTNTVEQEAAAAKPRKKRAISKPKAAVVAAADELDW
jgi:adenine-specific DNA glycosylase